MSNRSAGISKGTLLIAGVLVAIVAAFVVVVILDSRQGGSAEPPEGTEEIDVGGAGQHTDGTVDYAQTPPAGGEHNPVWQNCGVYEEPVSRNVSGNSDTDLWLPGETLNATFSVSGTEAGTGDRISVVTEHGVADAEVVS